MPAAKQRLRPRDWAPEPGTPEARLYTDFLRPRDWAHETPTALWL